MNTPAIPANDWDNFGHMICFHPRYDLGDKHSMEPEDLVEILQQEGIVALPLYYTTIPVLLSPRAILHTDSIRAAGIRHTWDSSMPQKRSDDEGFTRIMLHNGMFRTSLGIEMREAIFRNLYERFQDKRISIGSKVLDYPVSEITKDAIRIGCHTLRIRDLETLYKKATA